MTQKRLANIAGISTPTVSRFENSSENIALSSVFAILSALGLMGSVHFNNNEHWIFERDAVGFSATYGGKDYLCLVSLEAIEDNLGDYETDEERVRVVRRNRDIIREVLQEKIFNGELLESNIVVAASRELHQHFVKRNKKS